MFALIGGSGQLGTHLQKHMKFFAPESWKFNIINPDIDWLKKSCPQIDGILHCAADTRVNQIEDNIDIAISATMTNVLGTANMVKLANQLNVPLFHISTETCINPYNTYAKTKLLAEDMAKHANKYVIIRTSFRDDPFEYPQAPTDMYTIGDYVDNIAKLIIDRLSKKHSNTIEYIGTGVKTMFDLARKTRDIEPTTVEKMNEKLKYKVQPMDELNEIMCDSPYPRK